MRKAGLVFAACASMAAATGAWGEDSESPANLEQVTVYASQAGPTAEGVDVVTQGQMEQFNRNTLDQAIQLAPGTSVSLVGPRNETDVWIRGFDRWRTPLYQDGIPVYLPVDDRIDFSRFSTIDVQQIQVQKGFASVIDGPGAMGGAINLVSRIATMPLDGEVRYQGSFDSDGPYNGTLAEVFAGTLQGNWFLQAAGSFDRQTHFRLSDSFVPGTLQGPGDRIESYHEDYKINFKAGYVSPTTEASLNFIDQIGKKDNPPPDGVIPPSLLNTVKYWTWPAWDMQSAYLLTKTAIGSDGSFVKFKAYYERFLNQLDSFDTIAYDTQNTPKSFDSTYNDHAAGAIAELDKNLAGGFDTVRVSGSFRWDQHNETEATRNAPFATFYQQPWETAEESTSSLAVENILRPWDRWQVIVGASYDFRHLIGDSQWVANGTKPPFGYSFAYPVSDKHALNGEFALLYAYSDTGSFHLTYADRARFPTLFEMYSTRFGTFKNNPDLQPERSHYAQLGVSDTLLGTQVSVDAFFARVSNAIAPVALTATLSESQNVGTERQQGFEIELKRQLTTSLDAGANFSYLRRDELTPGIVLVDTPDQRTFAYVDWRPVQKLLFTADVSLIGRRWLQNAVNATIYYATGSYATADLRAAYQATNVVSLELGVENLTDRDVLIEDGYNGPGRQYFAGVRANF